MRTPRRPPVKSHYEPRESEFVSLLLAETTTPSPAPAPVAAAPSDLEEDEDDDLPPFMRHPDKPYTGNPARIHTRKLK